ncbi:GNAT family N-acetyltransferase [Cytobacillus sp. FSL R5-0596]|uniref:GNAT family N-acetyltransferase n=1 Tax=Cytobacillus sp. FSL R5-0596 TaxID=2954696 RepID=UPI0030F812F8
MISQQLTKEASVVKAIHQNHVECLMNFKHCSLEKDFLDNQELKFISIRDFHRILHLNDMANVPKLVQKIKHSNKNWSWIIGPSSPLSNQSLDLEEIGFQNNSESTGMFLRLDRRDPQLFNPETLKVKQITEVTDLEDWFKIFKEGYDLSEQHSERIDTLFKIYSDLINHKNQHFKLYMGFVNDSPAACCSTYENNRVIGIYDLATTPKMRRHKIATSMVNHILNAASLSNELAVLSATEDGISFFSSIGFKPSGVFKSFKFVK